MILRSILLLMIPLTTLLARPAAAADPQGLSPAVERFLERETWNRLRLDSLETDADPRYLPAAGRRFEVEYAWIPESAIHVQDSGLGSRTLRDEIFRTQGGRRHFRFIIHPESKEAYAPLLKQFPIAGKLMAIPTASTRTLYVWDPARPKSPGVFAKLTLDRKQTALGRAVADWEVRRSVRLTQAADQTPSTV